MRKNDLDEMVGNLSEHSKMKWRKLSPLGKKIVMGLFAAGVVSISMDDIINFVANNDKYDDSLTAKKGVLYLVDVNDDLKDIVLRDKNNNPVNYEFNDNTLAIVGEKDGKTKKGRIYEVVLVSPNGEVTYGHMDGKYLSDISIDDVDVASEDFNIFMVSSPEFINLITNETNNSNDFTTLLLSPKSTVLGASIANTSKESNNLLREIITINNNRFVTGYVNNNFLFDENYIKNTDADYTIAIEQLRLRADHCVESEELDTLKYGTEIKVINGVESYNDGNYEWVYVATLDITTNKIKFGWVAKTDYTVSEPIEYITKVDSYEDYNASNSYEAIQLSINSTIGLNLRDSSSIYSSIIAKLDSSITLFSTKYNYDNPISRDGYEWVYVNLEDGTKGWVCKDYIDVVENKNIKVNVKENKPNSALTALDFYSFGNHDGYYGIDVNIVTPAEELDEILKNGLQFNSSQYVSDNGTYKPSFAVIKCGATGWGNEGPMRFATSLSEKENFTKLLNVLQENNVPFSIYYFSQATTEEEAKEEIKIIKEAHEEACKYSLYSKNIFLDYECYAEGNLTRICLNAKEKGKNAQTEVINKMFDIAQETISDAKIRLYTDGNTLDEVIDYKALSTKIKTDFAWFVNPDYDHLLKLENIGIEKSNVGMFQIELDKDVFGTCVDLDFMYKEMYDEFVSGLEFSNEIDSNNEVPFYEASEPILFSKSCCVLDADSGDILYGINEEELESPASITKILSCYIALKYGNLDDKVTYTRRATTLSMPGTEYTASGYNSARKDIVFEGNTITLRDALHFSLFQSDNSTTIAIEEYVKNKLNCDFYELMNEEARNMGCTNPRFTNSFGYEDPNHLVSAHDMAKILAYIINNPTGKDVEIIDIMGKEQYTFSDGITTVESQNNPYYSDDVLGIKTGGHDLAGGTIVEAFKRGDRTLVVVDMGVDFNSWGLIFQDARNLADYCFRNSNIVLTSYTGNVKVKMLSYNSNKYVG